MRNDVPERVQEWSRGHKQVLRHLRKMRTWAGRLVRDIERKVAGKPDDWLDIEKMVFRRRDGRRS